MPAPRQPIEIREFPRPDLPPGAALLRTARVGGVRHRRAPVARAAGRRAVSDHSRVTSRWASLDAIRGPLTGIDGIDAARRGPRGVLRRASHLRPMPRVHGASHADALQRAPRLRHHRFGRRRAVRRMGAGDLSRAGRRYGAAARRRLLRGLHRRRLRPADGRAHPRARRDPARRHGAGAGNRRRRPERHRAGPPRRRVDRLRDWRAGRSVSSSRAAWAPTTCSISTRRPPAQRLEEVRDRTHGEASTSSSKPRARRAPFEEGLELVRDGGRYVIAGHYTDVGPSSDQRAPAHQSQASRDPRLLGQRAGPLPARAGAARASRRRRAVARDRRAHLSAAPG